MADLQPAPSIRATSARPIDAPAVGRRIVVYGPTGSGKTTVSRRIGALLGLPVVELDALYHKPNWQPTPDDQFLATALDVLSRHADGWVCDGNYGALRPRILPMADTAVWLRPPFLPTYWRLVKRTLGRMRTDEVLWNGNRESFRLTFLSRDSILLWGVSHWRAHGRNVGRALDEVPHRARVIVLRSQREIDRFLAGLEERAASVGPA